MTMRLKMEMVRSGVVEVVFEAPVCRGMEAMVPMASKVASR